MNDEITNFTVIRARQDLSDTHNCAPTAAAIARYLEAEEREVLERLRDLQRRRIVKERRRSGERVWVRWGEMR